MNRFTIIDHTGDIGIAWEAPDLPALFKAGASALAEVLMGVPPAGPATLSMHLELDAIDLPDLLVRFFQEILFRFETHGEVLSDAAVAAVTEGEAGGRAALSATLEGRPFDPGTDEVAIVIKAVTYHGLEVSRAPDGGWKARVIFDV